MTDDKKLQAIINFQRNMSAIMGAGLAAGMGSMGTEISAGMAGEEAAGEIREEAGQNIPKMMMDMLVEITQQFDQQLESGNKEMMTEIKKQADDPKLEELIGIVETHDIGLPKLTEKLTVDQLLEYLQRDDEKMAEFMNKLNSVSPDE